MADDVEAELARLIAERSFDRVATRTLEAYGDEVYGFLVSHLGNESDATEVFAQMGEDLWKGLPTFGARCSVRTWLYVLARHAASRFRRAPWARKDRRTGDSKLDDMIARAHTGTHPWQRTDVKDWFSTLRETLDLDDRTLLTLRVDRGMPWGDIARVTLDEEEPDAKALKRETDRLAKRFQLLKEQIRRKAKEMGILAGES
jgi:RNA polymerase sigma-70 factor (ECF subfamily)